MSKWIFRFQLSTFNWISGVGTDLVRSWYGVFNHRLRRLTHIILSTNGRELYANDFYFWGIENLAWNFFHSNLTRTWYDCDTKMVWFIFNTFIYVKTTNDKNVQIWIMMYSKKDNVPIPNALGGHWWRSYNWRFTLIESRDYFSWHFFAFLNTY